MDQHGFAILSQGQADRWISFSESFQNLARKITSKCPCFARVPFRIWIWCGASHIKGNQRIQIRRPPATNLEFRPFKPADSIKICDRMNIGRVSSLLGHVCIALHGRNIATGYSRFYPRVVVIFFEYLGAGWRSRTHLAAQSSGGFSKLVDAGVQICAQY